MKESDLPPLPVVPKDINILEAIPRLQASRSTVEASPLNAKANGDFGMLLHAHGLTAEAATCYRRAIILEPGEMRWHYYLGVVQQAQGDSDGAAASFDKVLAIRRSNVPAMLRRAQIDLDRGRFAEALKLCQNAVGFAPMEPHAYRGAGEALLRLGKLEPALQQLNFALTYAGTANKPAQWGRVQELIAETMTALNRPGDAAKASQLAKRQNGFEPPMADPLMDAVQMLRTPGE